jgi:hypothetical protein
MVTRVLLLLMFAASTLTLTHCRMVGDKLTGVQVGTFSRTNDCVKDCKKAKKDAEKAENRRHRDARRVCHGSRSCIEAEEARHRAALQEIEAAYRACVSGCHHQGGGRGGDDD